MNIDFIDGGSLSKEESEYLWSRGVSLDDWDYMLIMDYVEEYFEASNSPKSYVLAGLLHGCFENIWYRVNFRGSEKIIGVAYHS